jgi:hypothetical protein
MNIGVMINMFNAIPVHDTKAKCQIVRPYINLEEPELFQLDGKVYIYYEV